MENSKRRPAIVVDTREYEFSHGKRPRGRGGWAFGYNGRTDLDDLVWFSGLYSEALKAAKRCAPVGTVVITVMS